MEGYAEKITVFPHNLLLTNLDRYSSSNICGFECLKTLEIKKIK